MAINNTRYAYGSVAKILHWSVALCIFSAWALVEYRHHFTERHSPVGMDILQLHMSFGLSVGALVVLRIIWRMRNPAPHFTAPRWQQQAAKLMHIALYIFMLGMPLTGYLGTSIDTHYFQQFVIPKFEETRLFKWLIARQLQLSFAEFEKPMDFFHKRIGGQFLIWLLIGAHVGAALFHHFWQRDDVLRRMLPGLHKTLRCESPPVTDVPASPRNER